MRSTLLLLTLSFTLAISCNKKDKETPDPVEPPASGETVRTRLRLTGDILATESPLPNGRLVNDVEGYARELRDSTLYGVILKGHVNTEYGVRMVTISRGLFNNADSLVIDLPVEGDFTIITYVYKRGTGTGLYYTWQNGEQYFDWPIYTTLRNRMDSSGPIIEHYNTIMDTLSHFYLFDPLDSTKQLAYQDCSEIDAYRGQTTISATGAPAIISLNMKRMSFGLQFSASNFTSGKLHAEFPAGVMYPESVTPADINNQYFIYTTEEFKTRDSIYWPLNVKMTWEKPDGSMVPIGEKSITFKRNVLTKIHVTIPNTGRSIIDPVITETEWSGTETVEF
ncbi:hypothetical protein [Chitinophaga sp. XS-30]|uniref:hypothetical protein n=1 Tax=Chitinophaga sp. XS-30 TaxID=2604421 RepID=UPI0011DDA339|nr:hypothetical protein [Chitinophaga sp. XS-30]QEH42234.1 hypothetical protein FW415_15690 [Chitinophaga sp. XS-30]